MKHWLGFLRNLFLPPEDSFDWALVPWQPLLFLATWVSSLILLTWGDFGNIPLETSDTPVGGNGGVEWIWLGLSLVCPPLALFSLWLTKHKTGAWRYRGFWFRLAADVGQCAALLTYTIARFMGGDWRVYPTGILVAAVLFTAILTFRDIRTLIRAEKIARGLIREEIASLKDEEEKKMISVGFGK